MRGCVKGATRASRAISSPLSLRLSAAHVNPNVPELSPVVRVGKDRIRVRVQNRTRLELKTGWD